MGWECGRRKTSISRDVEKVGLSRVVGGRIKHAAIAENSLDAPHKVKHRTAM